MIFKSSTKSNKKVFKGILKWLIIFLGIIIFFVVGFYCFLKFGLNFDIFDFKRKLDLLSKPVNESVLVTNPFENSDAAEGFFNLFTNNNVYQESGGEYVFSLASFNEEEILTDVYLTDKQLASIFSVYFQNTGFGQLGIEENLWKIFQLKQITFDNFSQSDEFCSIDINYIIKFDLKTLKKEIDNNDFFVSLVGGVIPDYIYINSTFNLKKSKTESFSFTTTNLSFYLNQLSQSETTKVLSIFNFLLDEEYVSFNQSFDDVVCGVLFKNADGTSFIQSINGVFDFNFFQTEKILICLKTD